MVGIFDKNLPRIIGKTFLMYISLIYQEMYIVQFKYKCAKQTPTCSMFNSPQLKLCNSFLDEG